MCCFCVKGKLAPVVHCEFGKRWEKSLFNHNLRSSQYHEELDPSISRHLSLNLLPGTPKLRPGPVCWIASCTWILPDRAGCVLGHTWCQVRIASGYLSDLRRFPIPDNTVFFPPMEQPLPPGDNPLYTDLYQFLSFSIAFLIWQGNSSKWWKKTGLGLLFIVSFKSRGLGGLCYRNCNF